MIEVGEYIRTKKGYIARVTEIDNFIWFNEKINKESGMAVYELSRVEFKNLVTKHSKNIIDLIEEGDVIIYNSNYLGREIKMEVNYTCKKEEDYKWGEGYVDTVIDEYIMLDDIKTILTHEQYEQNCYKVGDIE